MNYKNIKKGDVLYEHAYNLAVEVEVITDPVYVETPHEGGDSWHVSFKAKSFNGIIDYGISPMGLMYNVGRLYYEPAYTGTILKIDGTQEEFNPFPNETKS